MYHAGSGVVYAIADAVLIKSTDYGITWSTISTDSLLGDITVQDINQLMDGTLLACGQGTDTIWIIKSTDDGVTWTNITDVSLFPSGANQPTVWGVRSVVYGDVIVLSGYIDHTHDEFATRSTDGGRHLVPSFYND